MRKGTLNGIAALGLSGLALAEGVDGADTAWMLVSTALVLLMTPALAFFYGGLVRSKNALNTMMMSFAALAFVGVGWALLGYTLAFGEGAPSWGSRAPLPQGVGPRPRAPSPTSSSWPSRGPSPLSPPPWSRAPWWRGCAFPPTWPSSPSGGFSSTLPWPTGSGAGGFWGPWAPWTSPEGRWCTSTPASPPWWAPWS